LPFTAGWLDQAQQHANRGAFAGAVGPDETCHPALGQGDIEIVYCSQIAEVFCQSNGSDRIHMSTVLCWYQPGARCAWSDGDGQLSPSLPGLEVSHRLGHLLKTLCPIR